ncbi:hypothetical protein FJZ17_00500 [Candidatus Pacearchaeota archaeon]|nr:hypothetical protein [Candidatus Pacearchaeota archaeon]
MLEDKSFELAEFLPGICERLVNRVGDLERHPEVLEQLKTMFASFHIPGSSFLFYLPEKQIRFGGEPIQDSITPEALLVNAQASKNLRHGVSFARAIYPGLRIFSAPAIVRDLTTRSGLMLAMQESDFPLTVMFKHRIYERNENERLYLRTSPVFIGFNPKQTPAFADFENAWTNYSFFVEDPLETPGKL